MNEVEAYLLGKQAAVLDFIEFANSGDDVNALSALAHETLDRELEKSAGLEESKWAVGVESSCYSFLKEASAYYGTYEVTDHDAALEHILEKVAADLVELLKSAKAEQILNAFEKAKAKLNPAMAQAAMKKVQDVTKKRDFLAGATAKGFKAQQGAKLRRLAMHGA